MFWPNLWSILVPVTAFGCKRSGDGVGNDIRLWTLFMDGASNVKVSGLKVVLIMPSEETLRQDIKKFPLTNNEVGYQALITQLELAWGLGSDLIEIKCDSQLLLNQVYGIFDTKEEHIR